jgi:Zn-dependent peptidase ImmA (M78 family)/DNA-binding XRE family transcriptional regulator
MSRLDEIDRARLGERLQVARNARGVTQEQAARALGVARTTMVAIERGERQVKPDELIALAALYESSTSSLLRETAVHVDLVGQLRRAPGGGAAEDRDALEAMALLQRLVAGYVELEGRLGQPLGHDYPAERALRRGGLEQQAEDLAVEVRNHYGLGLAPVQDMLSLVEQEMGVRVFIRRIPPTISGVFAHHEDVGACVLLNASLPADRRRWTLAHEVAHLVTERRSAEVCRAEDGTTTRPPGERFADLFAGAFLMPGAALRRRFGESTSLSGKFSPRDLVLMAHAFRVSVEAMCRRLEQLGLLLRGAYETLQQKGGASSMTSVRNALGEQEAGPRVTVPPRLASLAAGAYGRGLLSEGQVADMLAVDRVEAREILDAFAADEEIELACA